MSYDGKANDQHLTATASGAEALDVITRAEIDVQIATAKAYPRNLETFREEVMRLATCDPEIGEQCMYNRPVGKDDRGQKKYARGGSIRFAEIVAYAYGNLRVSARVTAVEDKRVVAEGVCVDLEKNMAWKAEHPESIVKKGGYRYSDRQVEVAGNAACAKAARNAVFAVVPKPLWYGMLKEIAEMFPPGGKSKTVEERRAILVEFFAEKGIDIERVLAVAQRDVIDDLTEDDLVFLRGLANAVLEGETSWEEAFPPVAPETDPDAPKTERLKQKLGVTKSGSGKKKKAAAVEPEPPAQKSGTAALRETGEIERDDLFAAPNGGTEPFTTSR